MAIKRDDEVNLSPAADDIIENNDVIVAIGSAEDLNRLEGMIAKSN
ncbi:TrkA C-terminal domain-containing protein [Clostridium perfringens]